MHDGRACRFRTPIARDRRQFASAAVFARRNPAPTALRLPPRLGPRPTRPRRDIQIRSPPPRGVRHPVRRAPAEGARLRKPAFLLHREPRPVRQILRRSLPHRGFPTALARDRPQSRRGADRDCLIGSIGEPLCIDFVAKVFLHLIKISLGRTRDFRVKIWGTSLLEDKLAGDLGNVIEAISIGGRRLDFLHQGKLGAAPGTPLRRRTRPAARITLQVGNAPWGEAVAHAR